MLASQRLQVTAGNMFCVSAKLMFKGAQTFCPFCSVLHTSPFVCTDMVLAAFRPFNPMLCSVSCSALLPVGCQCLLLTKRLMGGKCCIVALQAGSGPGPGFQVKALSQPRPPLVPRDLRYWAVVWNDLRMLMLLLEYAYKPVKKHSEVRTPLLRLGIRRFLD